MVAEQSVGAIPTAPKMRLRLRLPPRGSSGPDEVSILIRGDRTIEYMRPRICKILEVRTLDAYLTIDGRYIADESRPVEQLAQQGSCLVVCPRLRVGAPGDGADGQGGGACVATAPPPEKRAKFLWWLSKF